MRCCIASSTTSRLKDQHNQRFRWRPGPGECRKNAPCRYPERLGGPWRNEGFGRKGVAKGGGPQGSPLAAFSPLAGKETPDREKGVYGLPRRFWPAAATMAVSVQPPARQADRRTRTDSGRARPLELFHPLLFTHDRIKGFDVEVRNRRSRGHVLATSRRPACAMPPRSSWRLDWRRG